MYETRAGPKERVGLSEQPSTGMSMVWPMYTAKPMATGARAALALFFLFTAVSRTTYMIDRFSSDIFMWATPRRAVLTPALTRQCGCDTERHLVVCVGLYVLRLRQWLSCFPRASDSFC